LGWERNALIATCRRPPALSRGMCGFGARLTDGVGAFSLGGRTVLSRGMGHSARNPTSRPRHPIGARRRSRSGREDWAFYSGLLSTCG
jgi:hypothetical protein